MSTITIEAPSFRQLVRFAVPMIVSQASETVMLFVDRLFLSWLGKLHIAASMSGGLSAFVFASLIAGIVGYTNAIVAQYNGAGRTDRCVQTVSQGIYLSILFLPLLLLLIPAARFLFEIVGHSPEQVALEHSYFRILMAAAIFTLLRQVLAGFFLGIGKTRVVMTANVLGMVLNIPLTYVLVFGHLGMPALGIEGAAIATATSSALIFLVLLGNYVAHPLYREHRAAGNWKPRIELAQRLLRFGAPAGAELFLNVFAFNLFLQLMHSISVDVAAAVTITFNYDMVAFIPMIGLGVAVTAMVGQQMGAGRKEHAHKATMLALRAGYGYALVMMALFVFGAPTLVRVFAGGMEGDSTELLALASTMLRLAAIYTLADITQLVFAGALRGAGDTRAVMFISVAIHWAMAAMAIVLIRVLALDPIIVWICFIAFVLLIGLAMVLRYRSGKWQEIEVIDKTTQIEESHRPKIAVEPVWM